MSYTGWISLLNVVVTIFGLIGNSQELQTRRYLSVLLFFIFPISTLACVQQNWFEKLSPELQAYYTTAKGKVGVELFDALNIIISQNQKTNDYKTAKSLMYAELDQQTRNSQKGLIDVYSQVFIPGEGSDGDGYNEQDDQNEDGRSNDFINCEHTWPMSFFKKSAPMLADLHHLFPTLSLPNERRSDNPFGIADQENRMIIYSTSGKSKLAVLDSMNRSQKELQDILSLPYPQRPNFEKELDSVFEPGDMQKGNTARAMMYFYLRYHDQNIKQGSFNQEKFWNSKINILINWSETVDLVDEAESLRNQRIFKIQGNRNPFVDIQGLGELIGTATFQNK